MFKLRYWGGPNKKGLTIIELIVSLAILSIVIGIVFSFQLFNSSMMNRGIRQSDIQSQLRTLEDFIMSDVRNATEVTLTQVANTNGYYQVFVQNNAIYYKEPGLSAVKKSDGLIANPGSDLRFTLSQVGNHYELTVDIVGTLNANQYNISSMVVLNNIRTAITGSNAVVLSYKKGSSIIGSVVSDDEAGDTLKAHSSGDLIAFIVEPSLNSIAIKSNRLAFEPKSQINGF